MEKRLLLLAAELFDETWRDISWETALSKLERERINRIKSAKTVRRQVELLGGGLLIQFVLQGKERWENTSVAELEILSPQEILSCLGTPVEIEYGYGEFGKPYIVGGEISYSISHSKDMIFAAFSDGDIGADIQYRRDIDDAAVIKRFFTEDERKLWEQSRDEKQKRQLFYRLWCKKEAYGKLGGCGVVEVLQNNLLEPVEELLWEEYEVEEDYQIAVCRRKKFE
ncbi:MAG: 4'-phosphopantetheinyl transferase superfamily protein [Acetatifactor sp.]|nr:4'-phosphopantetheinyl transferase superfamily protein [Acetatifactor sp.]